MRAKVKSYCNHAILLELGGDLSKQLFIFTKDNLKCCNSKVANPNLFYKVLSLLSEKSYSMLIFGKTCPQL